MFGLNDATMNALMNFLSRFRSRNRSSGDAAQFAPRRALQQAPSPVHPYAHDLLPAADPEGFNRIQQCRNGPMLFNRFDVYVGGSFQAYGEFSRAEVDLFARYVSTDMVAIDIGANIGAHTVELAKMVGAKGWVYAFEPQRIVFQALCANLAINQITNVSARQNALGDTPGVIVVPDFDPTKMANFGGVALGKYSAGEQVALTRLDDIKLERCDFIKIDVEGMEASVVRGARETIKRHQPVLFVENDRPEQSEELIGLLFDMHYDLYWHFAPIYNPDNFYQNDNNIFSDTISVNMLCLPAGTPNQIPGMPQIRTVKDRIAPK
jgi:FkbM family methyltransferase